MPATLPIVRKSVAVPIAPDAAFSLFTEGLQTWWPVETHSLSASEGKLPLALELEPRLGGRIRETRHDGEPMEWATLTAWEPGRRLMLDWYVGRHPSQSTEIDVRFEAAPEGGTTVGLEHTGFERLGPAGEASAVNYDEGWDLVLGERFLRACDGR
jgi:hypothetical protein